MSSKIAIYLSRLFLVGVAILLVLNIGRILFGENGLYELQRMRLELSTLKDKNNRLESENNALFQTIDRLKNDPAYIEHIARQELQMIARDEIVFKFQDAGIDSGLGDAANKPAGTPQKDEVVIEGEFGIVEETLTE